MSNRFSTRLPDQLELDITRGKKGVRINIYDRLLGGSVGSRILNTAQVKKLRQVLTLATN